MPFTTLHPSLTLDSPLERHAAWVIEHLLSCSKAKIFHGAEHAARVACYVEKLLDFIQQNVCREFTVSTTELKLAQIAALFHDSGREAEGKDRVEWEAKSARNCYDYLLAIGALEKDAAFARDLILNKDQTPKLSVKGLADLSPQHKCQILLHDADCFDILRVRENFNLKRLYLWRLLHARAAALKDVAELRVLWTPFCQLTHAINTIISEEGDAPRAIDREIKKQFEESESCYATVHAHAAAVFDRIFAAEDKREHIPALGLDGEEKYFFRGITSPNFLMCTQPAKGWRSAAAIEVKKIFRNEKGNRQRSVSSVAFAIGSFSQVGLILKYRPDDARIYKEYAGNAVTGYGKCKKHYGHVIAAHKLRTGWARRQFKVLDGVRVKPVNRRHIYKMSNDEIVMDLDDKSGEHAAGVFYSVDCCADGVGRSAFSEFPLKFWNALARTRAIYVQQVVTEQTGRVLPIYAYSKYDGLRKVEITEQQIIDDWRTLYGCFLPYQMPTPRIISAWIGKQSQLAGYGCDLLSKYYRPEMRRKLDSLWFKFKIVVGLPDDFDLNITPNASEIFGRAILTHIDDVCKFAYCVKKEGSSLSELVEIFTPYFKRLLAGCENVVQVTKLCQVGIYLELFVNDVIPPPGQEQNASLVLSEYIAENFLPAFARVLQNTADPRKCDYQALQEYLDFAALIEVKLKSSVLELDHWVPDERARFQALLTNEDFVALVLQRRGNIIHLVELWAPERLDALFGSAAMQRLFVSLWQCAYASEEFDRLVSFFYKNKSMVMQRALAYGVQQMLQGLPSPAPATLTVPGTVAELLVRVQDIFEHYTCRSCGCAAMFRSSYVPVVKAMAEIDKLQKRLVPDNSDEIALQLLLLLRDYQSVVRDGRRGCGAFNLAISNAVRLIHGYCAVKVARSKDDFMSLSWSHFAYEASVLKGGAELVGLARIGGAVA